MSLRPRPTRLNPRPASGHRRWRTPSRGPVSVALAMALAMLGQLPAVQAGHAAPTGPGGSFASSFEEGQRPVDWTSTVETGADGKPKAAGVTGPAATGIPGNITDQVTAVTARAENAPNETAVKDGGRRPQQQVARLRQHSSWLALTSSPRRRPRSAVRPHLGQRRPRARPARLDPGGLGRRHHLDHLDTAAGVLRRPLPDQDLRRARPAFPHLPAEHHRAPGGLTQLADLASPTATPAPPPPGRCAGSATGPQLPAAQGDVGLTGLKALQIAGRDDGGPRLLLRQGLRRDVPVTADRAVVPRAARVHRGRPHPARTPRSTWRSPTARTCRSWCAATSTASS